MGIIRTWYIIVGTRENNIWINSSATVMTNFIILYIKYIFVLKCILLRKMFIINIYFVIDFQYIKGRIYLKMCLYFIFITSYVYKCGLFHPSAINALCKINFYKQKKSFELPAIH